MEQRIGIVGGGIVGLAVARELLRRRPGAEVTVLEKEDRVGAHQTGHNSGVVHAGIYYRPGSLKAELCTRGRDLLRDYCAEHALPYDECGKVVVAVDPAELGRFDTLERTARENAVPGLRRLDPAALRDVEPHAAGLAALHSPRTAITDYVAVAEQLAREITAAGGRVLLSTPVTGIDRISGGVRLRAGATSHDVDRVVLCGGLQADRLGRLAGGGAEPRILPFRGEYLAVAPAKQDLVRGMVYPVPDPRYPFLGVHFTRRVDGSLEVGPNAVLAPHRDAYRRSSVSLADLASAAAWPGFWRMAAQHWRTGVREVRGSLSVRAYLRDARRYVPEIGVADVTRRGFGVRAQAVERDGTLVDDFRIDHSDGVTSVRNAPSPAATSSLAIAEHVVDRMRA
ncbi:L-2-hydroxyglutarate oxidase [Pimelobacter simplex]|uniref:L-2-hydroxyglutarate oxidase n=1 Tax=Nocardioides simplex TaxID=2045 RepID=A0A0A1DNC4_NOCSI|nr:L-2-hydroxyglutarate oxidase [Pimelobacter simplex]AIY16895.1 L-2-hydroxyglutarate oxidase [Pimelobacter simplex]MCG8152022.1 L-2-hydroxyglutarate oxidase [Pimelobacter simplex]GEB12772.1 hydroxyglutarate oxidase [Pimelobacter simplex]SFM54535.1 L-2-hydroxyglutarate oxidase LhgO [Pimelobacter simplex]